MLENLFNFFANFVKSIFTFFKILLRSKLFLPKQKASSKEVIVLGNGPSLKEVLKTHHKELQNHTLLCVNKFPDTENFETLKPRYFLFTATGYFKPEKIKHEQEARENILNAIVKKTTWPITLYCPSQAVKFPKFIKRIEANPNIEICFFNTCPVEGLSSFNSFFMSNGWGMPRPHNVLIPSILTLINSGFKKIYLVGADHSWLPLISVNSKNEALINQQHFYDADHSKKGQMFRNSQPRRLHEILEKFMLSFRAYFELQDYAITKGIKIYNCTPDSYIDAFDRKDIAEVLGNNSKAPEGTVEKSGTNE